MVVLMTSEYLRAREMEHVLAALTSANALVLRVCLETGLRVGDVLAFRPPVRRQFWITEAKTGKRRRVNLRQALVDQLNQQAGDQWVFQGRNDPAKHRTRQAVWYDVRRAAKAFRIPVHVTPHSARKIYAVEKLAEVGGDVSKVQQMLNHADKATTMVYTMAEALYQAKYQEQDGRIIRRR